MGKQSAQPDNSDAWRRVLRTLVAALVGLLPVLPAIADSLDVETVPVVATVLAVSAAVTRLLALPEVESWLRQFAPWFAADVYDKDKEE